MYQPLVLSHRDAPGDVLPSRGLILCDRDGVIIEDRPDFVRSPSDVVLLSGAVEALVSAGEHGFSVVIISNQSGIGRGLVAAEDALDAHRALVSDLRAAGAPVLGSFLCPHSPREVCQCRKPSPRMLVDAMGMVGHSPSETAFIGDALGDMEAGTRAGVLSVLVSTGRGRDQRELVLADPALRSVVMARDLAQGIHYVYSRLAPTR